MPLLFYSRRIGLNNGLEVPVRAGGRLLGRNGPWMFGALNIQTVESLGARAASTNFSVVRVNRDVLRRSRVGMLVSRRDPMAVSTPAQSTGDNLAYGVDTVINTTDEVSIAGYAARTRTPGRESEDASYRGRFDWNADRYGLQAEHLTVEPNFNPEVGFLRRSSFRRSYGQARTVRDRSGEASASCITSAASTTSPTRGISPSRKRSKPPIRRNVHARVAATHLRQHHRWAQRILRRHADRAHVAGAGGVYETGLRRTDAVVEPRGRALGHR
jgi:hypothetical protein